METRNNELSFKEKKALLSYFKREGIKNDEELDFYIRYFLGWNIPKYVHPSCVAKGHIAPFQFISDMFFERVRNAFSFANRTGGKTLNVAILNHLDAEFKDDIEICSAGASKAQAGRCYRYFTNIYNDKLFAPHIKMEKGQQLKSQQRTELTNNSIVEVVTGSEKGFRSPHPQKLRIDEIELLTWDLLQTSMSMSISKRDVMGQNTYLSTRQHSRGVVQRLLDEAEILGIKVYKYCIWETLETCHRKCHGDPVYGDCPVYSRKFGKQREERLVCGGKAHDCRGGWYKIQDFIDKVTLMNWDTWTTEWLCLRPSGGFTVFGDYLTDEHFITWEDFRSITQLKELPKTWRFVSGLDFGSTFAYVKCAIDPLGNWWVFWSYYWDSQIMGDRTTSGHSEVIKKAPYWGVPEMIYGDKSAKQSIVDMRDKGLLITPCENARYEGVNALKELLTFTPKGNPRLRVIIDSGDNGKLREELEGYSHPKLPDGRPDFEDFIKDENDHSVDALRYAIFSDRVGRRILYRTYSVRGI